MSLEKLLLLPLFLHVLLILYVGSHSLKLRFTAVLSGKTKLSAIATDSSNWPDDVRKWGNNFDNQFQVPNLWYAVCSLVLIVGKADLVFVGLSWLFLLARVLHSYIHTGANDVPLRMRTFLASFAVVFLMWAWLALRLYVIG